MLVNLDLTGTQITKAGEDKTAGRSTGPHFFKGRQLRKK